MQEKIQNLIKEIINKIPIETEEISFSCDDTDQIIWCRIKTKEARFFINRDGEALRSLNHIVRKIVEKSFFDENKGSDPQAGVRPLNQGQRIIIDINDFHKKKIENLKTMAHMLSERAKFFKSSIETDPLPALDRKTIHEFLAEKPNIKTESTGAEPHRRVVIKYVE